MTMLLAPGALSHHQTRSLLPLPPSSWTPHCLPNRCNGLHNLCFYHMCFCGFLGPQQTVRSLHSRASRLCDQPMTASLPHSLLVSGFRAHCPPLVFLEHSRLLQSGEFSYATFLGSLPLVKSLAHSFTSWGLGSDLTLLVRHPMLTLLNALTTYLMLWMICFCIYHSHSVHIFSCLLCPPS